MKSRLVYIEISSITDTFGDQAANTLKLWSFPCKCGDVETTVEVRFQQWLWWSSDRISDFSLTGQH